MGFAGGSRNLASAALGYDLPVTSADLPEQFGRYRILSELGRGSMGRVFLAHDPHLDRKVALKVMAPLRLADPDEGRELERRFLNEARAAARLHHPGIVMVLDADTDPKTGSSYMAMELVEGRSLQSLLRETGRLPVATAVDLGAQAARALDHAHQAGVVHRDVKPANVLVTPEGRVKVTDFGIAKVASQSLTLTGHVLGSPFYMSPEQVKGEAVDGRTDLFSLGSILYQAVTGELPFGGDTLASVTYKVVQVDPRPLRGHDPDLPVPLEAVIERALAKDPDRRYQTGAEMAEALEAVGREEVVEGRPAGAAPTPPALPPQPTASRRALASVGCGMVLLLALGLLLFWPQRPPEPEDLPSVTISQTADSLVHDPKADAVELPETHEPPPVPSAELGIVYLHRVGGARISLWVDGELGWSRRVDRPGLFRRLSGRRVEGKVPVAPGPHTIEVRITASSRLDVRDVIQGSFRDGEIRWLRVGLNPVTKNLKLSWIE